MTHVPTSTALPRRLRPRPVPLLVVVALGALLACTACEPVPVSSETTTTTTAPVTAQNGDIGWEGSSYSGASGSPSGSKPESKLWWNDGSWWAAMWDVATGDFYVHELDLATHTWVRTATRLDTRADSRADALWDGTHLYVASHAFAEGSSSTPTATAELRRFSYDASSDSYTLDPGFPVSINTAKSETLVIEKDSQGRLWATWTEDQQVMVAVSNVGGSAWGAPFALPEAGTRVSTDDISSILAFGGDRVGIMWSNQGDDTMYFSFHVDGDPASAWSTPEVAYRRTNGADDHINLKNVADQRGRVLAAVKTSLTGSETLVQLLDRSPTGVWTTHAFGIGTDNHTRPIVVVDREHAQVQLFATSGQSGGSIYRKTAPLSAIVFPTGKGTAVLTDADNPDINNPTSTKQSVDSTTGLVVLATNDTTRRYWTHYDPLGGTGGGTTTSTSSTTTSTSTTSTSTSTTSSTTTTAPPTEGAVTFTATADATVKSSSPTRNAGTATELRTRSGDPASSSYLRFDLSGVGLLPQRAVLRLRVTDASKAAGTVSGTTVTWSETGITWANRPPALTLPVASLGSVPTGWIEIDVTPLVLGNGPLGLLLSGTSTDSAIFTSRETTSAPQLVVTPRLAI